MNPRPLLILAGLLMIGFGLAIGMGWIRDDTDPARALAPERVAEKRDQYRSERLWWVALVDGVKEDGPHEVYVRIFDSGGKLALCGYLPMRDGLSRQALQWLEQARLEIAGLRLSARFIAAREANAPPAGLLAGCIITERAFEAQLTAAKIDFTGQPLIQSRK